VSKYKSEFAGFSEFTEWLDRDWWILIRILEFQNYQNGGYLPESPKEVLKILIKIR